MIRLPTEHHEGYDKDVTKNDVGPRDGSEPLTVIEFSLTKKIRDDLKAALDIYRKGRKNNVVLAKIITDHFPPEVLTELGHLKEKGGAPATVYVVRNLPENSRADINPDDLSRIANDDLEKWTRKNAYNYYIGRGVGLALELTRKKDSDFFVTRYSGDDSVAGNTLHKHQSPISGIAGIISDGAPTRFTDMQTLLDSITTQKRGTIPNINITTRINGDTSEDTFRLNKLPARIPDWKNSYEIDITPADNKEEFEQLIKEHSQEVIVGNDCLALWAEDNRMFHQALPGPANDIPLDMLVRHIAGYEFYRPKQISKS